MHIYSKESLESVVDMLKRLSDQPELYRKLGVFYTDLTEAVQFIKDRLDQEDVMSQEQVYFTQK